MNKQTLFTYTTLLCIGSAHAQLPPSIQWQWALGGSHVDQAHAIQQTADGGTIVAGYTGSNDGDVSGNHGGGDAWVVKLNDTGSIMWKKALGGSDFEWAYAIQQTTDGGYIVTGFAESNDGDISGNHGAWDAWVVKLSDTGSIMWQRALGGSAIDRAYAIQQTSDGGYIVAGSTVSNDGDVSGNHGYTDAWVVKLSDTGNIMWQKALGGSNFDQAFAVQQTTDGGYIVAGDTFSNDGDVSGNHGLGDAWVVKLSGTGNIMWQKVLGGSDGDQAHGIQQTTDGGTIVAGYTGSNDGDVLGNHGIKDAWVVKLNDTGNIMWQKALGGSDFDLAYAIHQTTDGGYIVAGGSSSNDGDVSGIHGLGDAWVVKLSDTGNIMWQKAMGGSIYDEAFAVQQTTDGSYLMAGATSSNDGDVSGNHGMDDAWVVKLSSAGVGLEELGASLFNMMPNPSDGMVHLSIPSPLHDIQLTLTDALGREVMRQLMNGSSLVLDLTDQPGGIYLLTVRSAEGITSQRVVIE